jgi:hypothetical protein
MFARQPPQIKAVNTSKYQVVPSKQLANGTKQRRGTGRIGRLG